MLEEDPGGVFFSGRDRQRTAIWVPRYSRRDFVLRELRRAPAQPVVDFHIDVLTQGAEKRDGVPVGRHAWKRVIVDQRSERLEDPIRASQP